MRTTARIVALALAAGLAAAAYASPAAAKAVPGALPAVPVVGGLAHTLPVNLPV